MMTTLLYDYWTAFTELTARLRRNFSWYDQMLAESGYDEAKDPSKLPYIDEATLNQYYYNSDYPGLDEHSVYYTSGTSTGARKRIYYSTEDHQHYIHHRQKILSDFITPDCKVACADLGTGHAAASAMEIFQALGLQCFCIDFRKPIGEHIRLLNEYQPDVIFTMPMILENLLSTSKLNFNPKKIIVVGDVISKTWKKTMAERFSLRRTDLLDVVGSIEVGSIAYECFDCGLYHFDEHIIPEVVCSSDLYENAEYNGTAKVLILTSTTRIAFPAVRFVTNDLVDGFSIKNCNGRKCFSFVSLVGRLGNEQKNGEKISLYDICEAVNTYLPGSRFDVQKDSSRFIITVRVYSPDFDLESAENIKAHIRKLNPAIDQMIESSLVSDIEVRGVSINELPAICSKRSHLIKR